MAMASSMTRKASELKANSEKSPTQPMTWRERRKPSSTSVSVGANPGASSETSVVMVSSRRAWSMKWENTTMRTAERGMSESIMLCETAAVSSRP